MLFLPWPEKCHGTFLQKERHTPMQDGILKEVQTIFFLSEREGSGGLVRYISFIYWSPSYRPPHTTDLRINQWHLHGVIDLFQINSSTLFPSVNLPSTDLYQCLLISVLWYELVGCYSTVSRWHKKYGPRWNIKRKHNKICK